MPNTDIFIIQEKLVGLGEKIRCSKFAYSTQAFHGTYQRTYKHSNMPHYCKLWAQSACDQLINWGAFLYYFNYYPTNSLLACHAMQDSKYTAFHAYGLTQSGSFFSTMKAIAWGLYGRHISCPITRCFLVRYRQQNCHRWSKLRLHNYLNGPHSSIQFSKPRIKITDNVINKSVKKT